MGRVERSKVAVEARRRGTERRARLGGQVRAARARRRWTQATLADRAGVGRLVIGRLERGVGSLDLDVLERVSVALDLPLRLAFDRDIADGPADAGHLVVQELVLRLARAAGRTARFELASRSSEPWRSVDVGIADESHRTLLVIECWNSIGDVGAAARATTRKRADTEAAAVARWGESGRAAAVWVVRATASNRELVGRYPEVFAARFPGSSRQWVQALTVGTAAPAQDGLVWADVGATRLLEWRRR